MGNPAPAHLGSALIKSRLAAYKCPIQTGCSSIDNALNGGFQQGEINSIAGDSNSDKTLVALHALATTLLADDSSEAAVIDTTGSFDIPRLLQVLTARIQDAQTSEPLRDSSSVAQATNLLERVRLTRVFNLTGLLEVVEEIKHILVKSDRVAVVSKIANSEGHEASLAEQMPTQAEDKSVRPTPRSIGFLVVDNVTNILNAELSGSQIHGQASIAKFGRCLNALVKGHNVCALLLNAAVTREHTDFENAGGEGRLVVTKPALGKRYAEIVDLSMYVTSRASADQSSKIEGNVRDFEILEDRGGHREGTRCLFQSDGVSLNPCAKR